MKLQLLSFPYNSRRMLALALVVFVFLPTLTLTVSANAPADPPTQYEHFVVYQGADGNTVCREATLAEARELDHFSRYAADVHFETDFRSVYAKVIDNWLGGDSVGILGGNFRKPGLDFV